MSCIGGRDAEEVGILHWGPGCGGGGSVGAGGWPRAGWGLPAPAEGVWGAGIGVWMLGLELGCPAPSRACSLARSEARVVPAGNEPLP